MVYKKFNDTEKINIRQILLPIIFYSFVAGHINALFILSYSVPVTHMTGNLTHLGNLTLFKQASSLLLLLSILLSFFCGSVFSGFILEGPNFAPDRKYGILTILEGILIFLAALFGKQYFWTTLALCSFAMGLQNAFMSSYKGIILRTTHMTGIITDLGFLLGSSIRTKKLPINQAGLFTFILLTFIFGAGSGHWCFLHFQFDSLFIIAFFLIVSGSYFLARRLIHKKNTNYYR